jgi:hypothetical protein
LKAALPPEAEVEPPDSKGFEPFFWPYAFFESFFELSISERWDGSLPELFSPLLEMLAY